MARGTRAGSKRTVLRNAVWCNANRLTRACDPCEENSACVSSRERGIVCSPGDSRYTCIVDTHAVARGGRWCAMVECEEESAID
jgi:hypothetical protein